MRLIYVGRRGVPSAIYRFIREIAHFMAGRTGEPQKPVRGSGACKRDRRTVRDVSLNIGAAGAAGRAPQIQIRIRIHRAGVGMRNRHHRQDTC